MPQKPFLAVALVLGVWVALIAAYMASYGAMLKPGEYEVGDCIPGTGRYEILPVYRLDNDFVRIGFWPVHQADRRLFPQRWSIEISPH